MPMASLNPLRKMPASSTSSVRVTPTWRPVSVDLRYGFSTRWALASAAESVMVMTKPVATNPRRQSTRILLGQ